LLFTIADNGIVLEEAEKFKTLSAVKSKSIGISAIRERMQIFNGMNPNRPAQFELRNKRTAEGRGTIAKLTFLECPGIAKTSSDFKTGTHLFTYLRG
jgi:hypothetical protein